MAELFDRRLSRRNFLRVGAVAAASPLFLRTTRASAAVPAGPTWVAFGDDATNSLAVSSSLPSGFRNARLHYGPTADMGAVAPLEVAGVPGIGTRYGHAQLNQLNPDTAYHYQVEVDGTLGPVQQVRTAPSRSGPYTFTAFGDEGTT